MKLTMLETGQVAEINGLFGAVTNEPVLAHIVNKTEEDVMVDVTYFGVSVGQAYVTKQEGVDSWEWVQ